MLREAAKSLNTSGDLLNEALLLHLTRPLSMTGNKKRPAMHMLKGLEVSEQSFSLGALEQPVEIIQSIISELSLRDLQNYKAVNSRARSMVVWNQKYRNVITYAPEVVCALYKTDLDSAFTLNHIHDVLTHDRCVLCNRFGGYVFLPGLQRCCERCARYDPELIPISLGDPTKHSRSSVRSRRTRVPMMLWTVGDPMTDLPLSRLRFLQMNPETPTESPEREYLVSSASAARLGIAPNSPSGRVRMPCTKNHKYTWRQTTVPMPHLDSRTQILTQGYRCKGCTRAEHYGGTSWWDGRIGCRGCQRSLPNGVDVDQEYRDPVPRRLINCHEQEGWNGSEGVISCRLHTASRRLYTADEMLNHVAECREAQSLLVDLALLAQLPEQKRKTKPRWHMSYKTY